MSGFLIVCGNWGEERRRVVPKGLQFRCRDYRLHGAMFPMHIEHLIHAYSAFHDHVARGKMRFSGVVKGSRPPTGMNALSMGCFLPIRAFGAVRFVNSSFLECSSREPVLRKALFAHSTGVVLIPWISRERECFTREPSAHNGRIRLQE